MDILTKKQTIEKLFVPLEKEFGIKIFFNGQQPVGLSDSKGFLGIAYTHTTNKSIVLRWQRVFSDTVQTLFHEIGHAALHGKGSGCRKGKYYREAEAESVAKRACELLSVPYRACFKCDDTDYIGHYYDAYSKSCQEYGKTPDPLRHHLIEQTARRIQQAVNCLD